MMQYLRAAKVTVGKQGALGTEFTGLRVGFDIEKATSSQPNDAKIHVYNLSQKSRNAIEEADLICRLDVGYAGFSAKPILSQLFIGDIRYSSSRRQGPDWVTTIECGDSETALRGVTHDQSFPAMTSFDVIIKSLAGKLGVAVGSIAPAVGKVFENGFSVSGLVSETLDTITKTSGLEWHVTDGELNVLPAGIATTDPSIVVTPDTGLIGSPTKRRPDKAKGDVIGYEFQMLINAEVKPGRIVEVKSKVINAPMRVERVRFHGDTHQGNWIATVEAS